MKILYIEDDLDSIKIIKRILEKEYYIIEFATDGYDGLRKASMNEYDLIILDVNLPSKDGFEICKELRKNNSTPIIFLTSNIADEDLIKGLKIGGDDYIKKPFNKEELVLRIENILKRPKNLIEHKIVFDDFLLSLDSKKLFFKDKEIYLTKKEFNILELLFLNKNIVFSRDDIFYKIWDENGNPFSNNVEVFIKNIRKKIKEVTKIELIKNVKGQGYYIGNI